MIGPSNWRVWTIDFDSGMIAGFEFDFGVIGGDDFNIDFGMLIFSFIINMLK